MQIASWYTVSYYTYDVHGNVDTLLQDYLTVPAMSAAPYKRICYDYDLVSGKVNGVDYQTGMGLPDSFYYRYLYDAENRLVSASSSRDSITWEQDAAYTYYKHGPLARTVLGQLQTQGVDYSYTLQGWMKGTNVGNGYSAAVMDSSGSYCPAGSALVNEVVDSRVSSGGPTVYQATQSITFEAGFQTYTGDTVDAIINSSLTVCTPPGSGGGTANSGSASGMTEAYPIALDAYSFSLHYYPQDYKPIGQTTPVVDPLQALAGSAAPLYNGNIAAMAVVINPGVDSPLVYNYHYDQLNRLAQMDAFKGLNYSNHTFTPVQLPDYQERPGYDPNGNITTYVRHGYGANIPMDSLTYNYYGGYNRLQRINDGAGGSYTTDLKDQGTGNNYTYDSIGNLKKDVANGVSNIDWTVYGKIADLTNASGTVTYTYDAAGNRITKLASGTTTVYVRDAQGNVLSIYSWPGSGSPVQKEVDLYGSSRLGSVGPLTVAPTTVALASGYGNAVTSTFTRGEKSYELSNQLGNILTTITDKKIAVPSTTNSSLIDHFTADIATAQDYYPFGMLMPGRTYVASTSTNYRYGFNGKENDNEVKGVGNEIDYGMRYYDPRAGRFMSVDPLIKKVPYYTPYQYAGNSPVTNIDMDGLEEVHYIFVWLKSTNGKEAVFKISGETIGTPTGEIDKNGFPVYDRPYKIFAHYPAQAYGQRFFVTATYNSEEEFQNAKASDFYLDAIKVGANKGAEIANQVGDMLFISQATASLALLSKEAISAFVDSKLAQYSANLMNEAAIQDLVNKNISEQILHSELSAETKLATIEAGTPNAHFLSRHGAQTTLQEQFVRATTGMTPDGVAGKAVASSRFLTPELQLEALEKAEATYTPSLAGKATTIDLGGKVVGNGYLKGGGALRTATNVQVVYDKGGQVITMYPIIQK